MSLSPSPAAFALVRRFEGFRPEATPLPQGGWLVGYGHVTVTPPAAPLTEAQAEALLAQDLAAAAACVQARIFAPLTQNQVDALISLRFSIGAEAFAGSEVVRRLNAGEPIAAAIAFEVWRRGAGGGVLDALVRRRAAEQAHFLAAEPEAAAPSALLRAVEAPPAAAAPAEDPLARRLIEILAANPNTARVLQAPAAAAAEPEEEAPAPPRLTSAASEPGEGRLLLLAIAGALLVAAAAFSAASGFRMGLVVFGAPGLVFVLIAGYYLLKPPPLSGA